MFKERLISSIILVIVALITVITGGPVLAVILLVISIIGVMEIYRIKEVHNKAIGYIGYGGTVLYFGILLVNQTELVLPFILVVFVATMAVYVFQFPKYHAEHVMLIFFGFIYVTVMLSYIYQIRMLPQGIFIVWLVFISSWGCDTCAYCVGVLIGKHKMAPILSPKKSIEGAIGGLVGAGILGAVYAICINQFAGIEVNIWIFAIICVVGGMISMVGDLAASGFKRDHNVKDYGRLIPGHGGVMDRFDSVIFTAPIIYYMVVYLV